MSANNVRRFGHRRASAPLQSRRSVEEEFEPSELRKAERLKPRRYSYSMLDATKQDDPTLSASSGAIPVHFPIIPEEPTITKQEPLPQAKKRISYPIAIPCDYAFDEENIDYLEHGFLCTPKCYKRSVWLLCFLEALLALLWIISIALVCSYWPAGHLTGSFIPGDDNHTSGTTRIIIIAFFGSEPILSFVLLLFCLILRQRNKEYLRIFYVVNSWLMICLIVVGICNMIFSINVAHEDNVRNNMFDELLKYDDGDTIKQIQKLSFTPVDTKSHQDWDELQIYFKCCGVDSERDWYDNRRGYQVDTHFNFNDSDSNNDETYWKVPHSCCNLPELTDVNNEDFKLCIRFPEKYTHLIYHNHGCMKHYYELLQQISFLCTIQIFIGIFVQSLSIFVVSGYYTMHRFNDKTGYKRNWKTFFYEFIFLACILQKPSVCLEN